MTCETARCPELNGDVDVHVRSGWDRWTIQDPLSSCMHCLVAAALPSNSLLLMREALGTIRGYGPCPSAEGGVQKSAG